MIQFLNPIWLWGLTGLLIPIGIHLLSRKEGKIIYIGSLRHLTESNTAQLRNIRINEVVLFLLRCLLIVLIVLLMAGVQIQGTGFSAKKWVVIEKGIEKEEKLKSLLDSLQDQGYKAHYLNKNFPIFNDSINLIPIENYWKLVEDLTLKSLDDIVVISYNYAQHFKGKRVALPNHLRWVTVEPAPVNYLAKAVILPGDSVWLRKGRSSPDQTVFESKETFLPGSSYDSLPPEKIDSITITIFHDAEFDHDLKIVLASLKAIETVIPYDLIVTTDSVAEYKESNSEWIIWLSENSLQKNRPNSIIFRPCAISNLPLIVQGAGAKFYCGEVNDVSWILTKRLNEELALKENFNLTLATIILNARKTTILEKDKRVLPEALTWSSVIRKNTHDVLGSSSFSIDQYIFIALSLILIIERWMAYKRSQ